jgi:hypothetical protein
MSLKNPVTRPGIDPGTVRLVAQRLTLYYRTIFLNSLSAVNWPFRDGCKDITRPSVNFDYRHPRIKTSDLLRIHGQMIRKAGTVNDIHIYGPLVLRLCIFIKHNSWTVLEFVQRTAWGSNTGFREQITDASYCCLFRSSKLSWRILSGTRHVCACHAFCVAPLMTHLKSDHQNLGEYCLQCWRASCLHSPHTSLIYRPTYNFGSYITQKTILIHQETSHLNVYPLL